MLGSGGGACAAQPVVPADFTLVASLVPRHGRTPAFDAYNEAGDMLQMRPSCECCDKDLPPELKGARICSFECTFCEACATSILDGTCPNCGGELVARPTRPTAKLANYPASMRRVYNPGGCVKAAA